MLSCVSGGSISRFLKVSLFFLAVCIFFGGGGFLAQMALTKQLGIRQLAPLPERFTELYFTDHRQLPATVKPPANQKLQFTVHNREHQTTTYQYQLIATTADNSSKQPVAEGALTIAHDQAQVIDRTVAIPPLDKRVAVEVKLEYRGIRFGHEAPRLQTQSIHFWVTITGPTASPKEHRGATS